MHQSSRNICVTLPGSLGYCETFLQAHREKLSPFVNYLDDFPIDPDYAIPKQVCELRVEGLKRSLRSSWYTYGLNPARKILLRQFFQQNKIGVVLAEYGLTGLGIFKACRELNMPLVVHFHGADAYLNELIECHRDRYRRMFDYASAIIAVSKHMTVQLVRIGAPAEKVFYNAYGVELDRFRQEWSSRSQLQVLSVGRFVEKKAPYLTILAFKKVLERVPGARLVMAGAGPLLDVCSRMTKSLHIEDKVELRGIIDHEDVATLMQQSSVFVQHSLVPSSGDSEGTPVAILEAGATGLPIVSTRHAGITDAVIHGETGFLVEEGDSDGMAEFVYQLLTNPELAQKMGKKSREHIAANFDMEHSIKKLRQILEQCN